MRLPRGFGQTGNLPGVDRHIAQFATSLLILRFSLLRRGAALTQGSRPFHVPETEAGIIPSMSGQGPRHDRKLIPFGDFISADFELRFSHVGNKPRNPFCIGFLPGTAEGELRPHAHSTQAVRLPVPQREPFRPTSVAPGYEKQEVFYAHVRTRYSCLDSLCPSRVTGCWNGIERRPRGGAPPRPVRWVPGLSRIEEGLPQQERATRAGPR
jgi:hypothetical protein